MTNSGGIHGFVCATGFIFGPHFIEKVFLYAMRPAPKTFRADREFFRLAGYI